MKAQVISAMFLYQNDKPSGIAFNFDRELMGDSEFSLIIDASEHGIEMAHDASIMSDAILMQLKDSIKFVRKAQRKSHGSVSKVMKNLYAIVSCIMALSVRKVIPDDNFNGVSFIHFVEGNF